MEGLLFPEKQENAQEFPSIVIQAAVLMGIFEILTGTTLPD
jgi:hypothetical protein